MKEFRYGEGRLDTQLLVALEKNQVRGSFSAETVSRIKRSSEIVQNIAEGTDAVYGINTGFGPLCTVKISPSDTKLLQTNILKSHAVGVGEPIAIHLARYMMILKLHSLAQGYSGIQLGTLERIKWMLEENITPWVPSQGSVGASGDLAPLSHLFLPLIGYGKVFYCNKWVSTREMMSAAGIAPLALQAKEGLALINGTQFMLAHAAAISIKFHQLLDHADLIAAIMVDALKASVKPFHPALHELRAYHGNKQTAHNIYQLVKDSAIVNSHHNCSKVQDPYSLRCVPQVHGAARNALAHLDEMLQLEIDAVTDNPIIIDEELIISGGNFHGQPIALPMDYICLAASELASISDRRIYLSLEGKSDGVPTLLMNETGINSGFMILQYTSAALASECKTMCFPASADSIPTSLGQEDHVSMGSISGRKALQVLSHVEKVLAIELICATQALDFHRPLVSTCKIMSVRDKVRETIPFMTKDDIMYEHIESAMALIDSGQLLHLINFSAHV